MASTNETWQKKWTRRLVLAFLVAAVWMSLPGKSFSTAHFGAGALSDAIAAEPDSSEPGDGSSEKIADAPATSFLTQLVHLMRHIFNSRELMKILGQKEFTVVAFIALNLIVFVETGLLIGFFLPGDSLLVTAGIVCAASEWNLSLLLATLCISAIVGDSVGYSIGFKSGPRIFNREKSFVFHKEHLLAAQRFYESHGGKTIILARFMPIIRTFAPVVAGVGKMNYRRFLFFNIFGGIGWVVSMILIGYYLRQVIEPPFKMLLGEHFEVQDHIEKVIIVVVLLSVAPGGIYWLKKKFGHKPVAEPQLVGNTSE